MRAEAIQFDQIRYNPALEAFEARVRVTNNTDTLYYAVSVTAPVTADYKYIARRLHEEAQVAHLRARGGMRLRRCHSNETPLAA